MCQFFVKEKCNRNKVKWHWNALTLYLSHRTLLEEKYVDKITVRLLSYVRHEDKLNQGNICKIQDKCYFKCMLIFIETLQSHH